MVLEELRDLPVFKGVQPELISANIIRRERIGATTRGYTRLDQ